MITFVKGTVTLDLSSGRHRRIVSVNGFQKQETRPAVVFIGCHNIDTTVVSVTTSRLSLSVTDTAVVFLV